MNQSASDTEHGGELPLANGQGKIILTAASVLTGVLAATTIYAAKYHLGSERFAPVAQLLTVWALCAASLTFGVQQWVVLAVVQEKTPGSIRRALVWPSLSVAVIASAVCAPMVNRWFDGDYKFVLLVAGLAMGTVWNGYSRGLSAASGRAGLLAFIVVGENFIRVVLLIPLFVADATAPWFGAVVVAGFFVNFTPLPRSFARIGKGAAMPREENAVVRVLLVSLVGFVSYATMFGAPLFLAAAAGTSGEVSALFLLLTLARIPSVIVLGVLPRLAFEMETSAASGGNTNLLRWMRNIGFVSIMFAAVVAGVAAAFGTLIFGQVLDTDAYFGSSVYALVGAAAALALGSQIVTVVQIASRSFVSLLIGWSIPIVGLAVGFPAGSFDTAQDVALWLLVVQLAILISLLGGARLSRLRTAPTGGSQM
jgi:hypothetical protein